MKLSVLASQLGATLNTELTSENDVEITGISSIDEAGKTELTFLANPIYAKNLAGSKAAAVLVREAIDGLPMPTLLVDNPSLAFSQVTKALGLSRPTPAPGIAQHTAIDSSAVLGEGLSIQAFSVIEANSHIGDGTCIYPHVYIGPKVSIGKNCIIYPNVSILDGTIIGDNVIINSGTVIGSDGFGFDLASGENTKIDQIGIVEIQDNVDIGANCTVDRARFSRTIIGKGTKIDNLVQIAHNVKLGQYCMMVSQSGVAGSAELGNNVIMAGRSGIMGHLKITDNTIIAANSAPFKDIETPGTYAGFPAIEVKKWRKELANIRKLDKMRKQVKELNTRLDKLENQGQTK